MLTDDTANDPYVLYLRKLEREEIRQAIDSLSILHRQRCYVTLKGSVTRDCHHAGRPAGTVMSRLGRARKIEARSNRNYAPSELSQHESMKISIASDHDDRGSRATAQLFEAHLLNAFNVRRS